MALIKKMGGGKMKQKKLFLIRIVDVFCPITLMVLIAATVTLLTAMPVSAAEKR